MKRDNVLLWSKTRRLNKKILSLMIMAWFFFLKGHQSHFMIRLGSDKNVNYTKVTSTTIGVYAVLNLRIINSFWSITNIMAN